MQPERLLYDMIDCMILKRIASLRYIRDFHGILYLILPFYSLAKILQKEKIHL